MTIVANDATCHVGGASDCPIGSSAGYTCSNNPVVGTVAPGPGGDAIPYGLWIGRVGAHGKPFAIKSAEAPSGPGELYLLYNDCAPSAGYSDNAGSASFLITGVEEQSCPVYKVPKVGSSDAVGTVIEIAAANPDSGTEPAAYIQHGANGERHRLAAGDSVRPGDILSTGPNTVFAFEGVLGGKVGVNKNAKIEVTGPRTVKDVAGTMSVVKSKAALAAKCGQLKEPLEIQTDGNGAIKG